MSDKKNRSFSLQRFWHDAFYSLAPKSWVKFALTCQKAAEGIDLGLRKVGVFGRVGFLLHLSLCSSCMNYSRFGRGLKKNATEVEQKEENSILELNSRIIKGLTEKNEK
jgi:hypothetical protein